MILFIDAEGRIKDVDTTADLTLTPVELEDAENPFIGWSKAKICCYKIAVSEVPIYPDPTEEEPEPEPIGVKTVISMMTPYVDSRLLEHIDQLGKQAEAATPYTVSKNAYIDDTEIVFNDVPDGTMSVSVKDSEGNYPDYTTERTASRVVIHFAEPLTKVTTVTISVL